MHFCYTFCMTKPNIAAILKTLPEKPGVYIMRDAKGDVLYVGKAIKLKRRVSSYFRHGGSSFASPRLRKLVSLIEDISIIRAETEAEALIIEAKLIRSYSPFFNVDLKMSDRYPYLRITNEPFPRLVVTRKKEDDGSVWFGPYVSAGNIHDLLRLIERYFSLRSCRMEIKGEQERLKKIRPCIEYSLGRCMGVCAALATQGDYRERVNDVILLLRGQHAELVENLRRRMDACANKMAFEEAARYRDTIRAIWRVSRQRVSEALQEDLNSDAWKTLTDAQKILGLKTIPWRIDAFDISHMSGKETYGCCVVFEQGRPNPSLYRRFKIRTLAEGEVDDFRAIKETVSRRYRHVLDNTEPTPQLILIDGGSVQLEFAVSALEELKKEAVKLDKIFNPPENPLVIALAKEEELIFRPGAAEPLRLSFDNPVLRLLQQTRDEVHRYAITTHRNARVARLRRSALEEIPGIGKNRAAQLLVKFGSVQRIAALPSEELCVIPGVGPSLAKKIIEHLNKEK